VKIEHPDLGSHSFVFQCKADLLLVLSLSETMDKQLDMIGQPAAVRISHTYCEHDPNAGKRNIWQIRKFCMS